MAYRIIDYSRHSESDLNESEISGESQLRQTLARFQQQEPGFVDLISPSGDTLSMGIGGPLACAMFIGADGDPPYLWALGSNDDDGTEVEFERGGTPTPVPIRRCLPFERVAEIAATFFRTGKLPDNEEWDED